MLPVAPGATTAEVAAAEPAKAGAAATTTAATTKTTAPAAAHPGSATVASAKEPRKKQKPQQRETAEEQEDDEKNDERAEVCVMVNLLARDHRRVSERHVGIGCDDLSKLADGQGQSAIIIPGAEIWDHFAADIAYFGVVQDALKTITHIDAVLAVVDCEQHQCALVCALLADLPGVFKLIRVVGGVVAVEVADGDDGNLGVGSGVVKLAADAVELGDGLRRKHMGEVADVVGGFGQVFDCFGPNERSAIHQEPSQKQLEGDPVGAAKNFHRS